MRGVSGAPRPPSPTVWGPPTPLHSATRASCDARCSRPASLVAPGTPQGMPVPKVTTSSLCVRCLCPTLIPGVRHFGLLPNIIHYFFNPKTKGWWLMWFEGWRQQWGVGRLQNCDERREDGTWKDLVGTLTLTWSSSELSFCCWGTALLVFCWVSSIKESLVLSLVEVKK